MEDGIYEVPSGIDGALGVKTMIMGAVISQIARDIKSGELPLDDIIVQNTFYPCFEDFSFEFMRAINMKLNEENEEVRKNVNEFIDECEKSFILGKKDLKEFSNKQELGGL